MRLILRWWSDGTLGISGRSFMVRVSWFVILVRRRQAYDYFSLVRILQHRSVAFVTYQDELQAQFAKEAMACQSLDNDEILNVRYVASSFNLSLQPPFTHNLHSNTPFSSARLLQQMGNRRPKSLLQTCRKAPNRRPRYRRNPSQTGSSHDRRSTSHPSARGW